MSTQRSGILAGGNFIVDYVKVIDFYPEENMAGKGNMGDGCFALLSGLPSSGSR